jgi:hypothetical protein
MCPSLLSLPLLTRGYQDLVHFSSSQRALIRAVAMLAIPSPTFLPLQLLRLITLLHLPLTPLHIRPHHPFLRIPLHQGHHHHLSLLLVLLRLEIHLMVPAYRGNPLHPIWRRGNPWIGRRVDLFLRSTSVILHNLKPKESREHLRVHLGDFSKNLSPAKRNLQHSYLMIEVISMEMMMCLLHLRPLPPLRLPVE